MIERWLGERLKHSSYGYHGLKLFFCQNHFELSGACRVWQPIARILSFEG